MSTIEQIARNAILAWREIRHDQEFGKDQPEESLGLSSSLKAARSNLHLESSNFLGQPVVAAFLCKSQASKQRSQNMLTSQYFLRRLLSRARLTFWEVEIEL